MEKTISKYESDIEDIERSRKAILKKAKEKAAELLKESNKKIENAIREIRESQAEKEETRRIRQELDAFKQEVQEIDTKESDDKIARKIAQIQQRKERHAKRQAEKRRTRRRRLQLCEMHRARYRATASEKSRWAIPYESRA